MIGYCLGVARSWVWTNGLDRRFLSFKTEGVALRLAWD